MNTIIRDCVAQKIYEIFYKNDIECFLTGSQRFRTDTEDSDLNFVVYCDKRSMNEFILNIEKLLHCTLQDINKTPTSRYVIAADLETSIIIYKNKDEYKSHHKLNQSICAILDHNKNLKKFIKSLKKISKGKVTGALVYNAFSDYLSE